MCYFRLFMCLLASLGLYGSVVAQLRLDSLQAQQLSNKVVWKFTQNQKKQGLAYFAELPAGCVGQADTVGYRRQDLSFKSPLNSQNAWQAYKEVLPYETWNHKVLHYNFSYLRQSDSVYYKSRLTGIREGQLMFFHLKVFGGLKKIGVGFEVTRVDELNQEMEFCYLKNGKAEGTQILRFNTMADGETKIDHITWYKSKSKFRDRYLYPGFHKRFVKEFHQRVWHQFNFFHPIQTLEYGFFRPFLSPTIISAI